MNTIFILQSANRNRRHVNVAGRFHCYVSLASVARIARYAARNGLTVLYA